MKNQNYSIQLFLGEKRSGKTLCMVATTYNEIKGLSNKPIVYANFQLNKKYFPTYKPLTKKDLISSHKNKEEYKNCIILCDEVHIWLDSRKFMGKDGNSVIGYFLGQMGKRKNVFKGTTHYPRLCDFRLRMYCERWIYIRKGLIVKDKGLAVWKPILNNNRILNDDENERLYIKNQAVIRKLVGFDFIEVDDETFLIKGRDYFKMYDTEEFILDE